MGIVCNVLSIIFFRKRRFLWLAYHGKINKMPDEEYLEKMFECKMGYKLDLKNPQTFNEKLQWLKLHDRQPIYTMMVDKYEVKRIIAEKIGEQYVIPTLGVWNRFEDIDFDTLPEQFVLKCTHDSGGVFICKDKKSFDFKAAKDKIENSLEKNYYFLKREWPYKDVNPRIIAEKYMVDESGTELKDYKVFCFNGKPKYIQVDFGRFTNHERNLYSTEWEYMGFTSLYPTNKDHIIQKPDCLEEMLRISELLSKDVPFLRVDLYVINSSIYFGELTFSHGGGFEQYEPVEWDKKLGDILQLPFE